jgi:hypothetical protein
LKEAKGTRKVPGPIEKDLARLWSNTREPLQKALESRMAERAESLTAHLAERCEKEASDQEKILRELAAGIEADLKENRSSSSSMGRSASNTSAIVSR